MNITQKQEYRYQFAGMAMQAMINAIWSNPTTQDEVTATAKRKEPTDNAAKTSTRKCFAGLRKNTNQKYLQCNDQHRQTI